jgi:hypothetical protein
MAILTCGGPAIDVVKRETRLGVALGALGHVRVIAGLSVARLAALGKAEIQMPSMEGGA